MGRGGLFPTWGTRATPRRKENEKVRQSREAGEDQGAPPQGAQPRGASPVPEGTGGRWRPVAAIRLLLFTGCRKNEALSLRWSEVSLDENRISLRDTKNRLSRIVALNAKARDALEGLLAGRDEEARTGRSEYVFPSRRGSSTGDISNLRDCLAKACKRAGIENLRIHDPRSTFVTMQAGRVSTTSEDCLGTKPPRWSGGSPH